MPLPLTEFSPRRNRAFVSTLAGAIWCVTPNSSFGQTPRPLLRATVITEATLGVPLTRIYGMAIGPNGAVAITLSPQLALVIVRDKAKPLIFSRSGEGPGELRSPDEMGWRGDSLWVGDGDLTRVTLFTANGKVARTIPVQVRGSPVLLRDGSIAVIPPEIVSGPRRPGVKQIRHVFGGALRDTLVSVFSPNRAFSLTTPEGMLVASQPYDDAPLWRAFSNGSGFVVIKRVPDNGKAATYSVTRYSEKGKVIFDRAYPFTPIAVSDQDVDARAAGYLSDSPNRDDPALQKAARAALYRPTNLPTVSSIITGSDGSIWLARERVGKTTPRWTLLNAKGDVVGDFLVPNGFTGRTGTTASLWGVVTDADGVPSVMELRVPGRGGQ